MRKFYFIIFLVSSCSALYSQSQSYRYLRVVIDTSFNFQFREMEWFDGGTSYPIPAMTAYNAPAPLLVSGDNPNWQIYRIYDDDPASQAYVGDVQSDPAFTHEFILDMGGGNGILPDSVRITKPLWSGLISFRILLSEDETNWDLYLDTTIVVNFDIEAFPLTYVPDIIPPSIPQNLQSSHRTSSQAYFFWEPSSDNFLVTQYNIYQDGSLIDSTTYTHYAVQGLSANTSYDFHVTALDKAGNESMPSNTINISTLNTDNIPPILSGNINVQSVGPDTAAINWTAASDNQAIAGYLILLDGVYIGSSDLTTFTICGLNELTAYNISIIAKDISGNMSASISGNFTTTAGDGVMKLGTNFWNQFWSVPNIQLFVNGFQNVTGPNPWKPALLDELDYANTLRFMEMQQINRQPSYIWNERRTKNDAFQDEIAIEWMIDLCNRKHSNLWVCIPAAVIDRNRVQGGRENYLKKLAILIKTGIDMGDRDLDDMAFQNLDQFTPFDFIINGGVSVCEPLAPGLKIYIEYGNENWNITFPQVYHCNQEGLAMGLSTNQWTAGRLFSAYASLTIFQEFREVFGAGNSRVEKVLPIQSASLFFTNLSFTNIFDNATFNPDGILPDLISGHTYFGRLRDGADPNIEQQLCDDIGEYAADIAELRSLLDILGNARGKYLKMISYEGGHHVTTNYADLNANPVIYDLYLKYLDTMSVYFEEIVLYDHMASNAFGLKQYVGQPISEAHKYRAVINWQQSSLLPVDWVYFNGKIMGDGAALLTWATATEINNEGYTLEKSMDGINYVPVAFIKGKNNGQNMAQYEYLDTKLYNGINYYRLKQKDFDGNFSYSKTISVEYSKKSSLAVFPNPFEDIINVQSDENNWDLPVRIYDSNGHVVYQADGFKAVIDMGHFPKGVYFMAVKNELLKLVKK